MVDQDGILVRPGARMVPRKTSVVSGVMGSSEPKVVPPENRCVMLKYLYEIFVYYVFYLYVLIYLCILIFDIIVLL